MRRGCCKNLLQDSDNPEASFCSSLFFLFIV